MWFFWSQMDNLLQLWCPPWFEGKGKGKGTITSIVFNIFHYHFLTTNDRLYNSGIIFCTKYSRIMHITFLHYLPLRIYEFSSTKRNNTNHEIYLSSERFLIQNHNAVSLQNQNPPSNTNYNPRKRAWWENIQPHLLIWSRCLRKPTFYLQPFFIFQVDLKISNSRK